MIRIIPAIDLLGGRCVRLKQGDFQQQKIFSEDPTEVAMTFERAGMKYLHVVDLDGAKTGVSKNEPILEQILENTNLAIDLGGGIRTEEALKRVFERGVQQITVGSLAVNHPRTVKSWIKKHGANRIIIGTDVYDGFICIHGWQKKTEIHYLDFISNYCKAGAKYFVCTDIRRDGEAKGSSIDLYRNILAHFNNIRLIASGGVSSIDELKELDSLGLDGAIIGLAIYEARIKLEDLAKAFNLG